ncbi:MAG: hypothetical protein QG629_24 [Patescibacteria group bacterium]|nr:hypothetical protein [Candidatus Saccharibacteria bacterium]MDQ5962942.1 hypothetical protein [Patescibacteria group bacterium]
MNSTTLAALGIAAALLNILGTIPYIRDILRGKTKPERMTWWIWAMLMGVILAAQISEGASWAIIWTATTVVLMVAIGVLSIRYGYGRMERRDYIALLLAVTGVILWKITENALVAVMLVVAVDAVAAWLTAVKTWRAPQTETLVSWVASTAAAALNILSAHTFNLVIIAYAVYAFVANAVITSILVSRR